MNKKTKRIIEYYSSKFANIDGAVYDQDDLKQEIIINLIKSFGSLFDSIDTPILKMSAYYSVIDFVRKNDMRKRGQIKAGFKKAIFCEYCNEIGGYEYDPIDKIWLQKAISKLKPMHRITIIAYYFLGLQIADIAKEFGITKSAVSFNHRNALKVLRRSMTVDRRMMRSEAARRRLKGGK